MFKKRKVYILSLVLTYILALSLLSVFAAEGNDLFGEDTSGQTREDAGFTVETLSENTEVPGVEVTPAQKATDTQAATPVTYDVTNVQSDLTVTEVPEDVAITTTQGTISSFSMTNALFSLGSLIQGSFISFSNNNNLFFGSIFDASEFTATLDEDGELEVGQQNAFGDFGKVVVSIQGGNLTQDEAVIFVPDGNEPTYIYYNTTEVEFKDGDIYLLGESISNTDQTSSSTTLSFDENGFTRLELHPQNVYTIFEYAIENTGEDTLIICKKDPLCQINIDEDIFTIQGKVHTTYKQEFFYESLDEENRIVFDASEKTFTLSNARPSQSTLLLLSSGQYILNETSSGIFHRITKEQSSLLVESYSSASLNQNLSLYTNGSLLTKGFSSAILL